MASNYNRLPDIEEAFQALHAGKDHLTELSRLLVEFRLQRRFGICLVHKHFHLDDDEERVVELRDVKRGRLVSSIFRKGEPDALVIKKYQLDIPNSPTIIGSMFLVRGSGLLPYEYICISEAEAEAFMHTTKVDAAFLAKWMQYLENSKMVDILGLALLEGSNWNGKGLERSYPESRVTVTRRESGKVLDEYVTTVWSVSNNGELKDDRGCSCSTD